MTEAPITVHNLSKTYRVPEREAEQLRHRVTEELELRASSPLTSIEFERLRDRTHEPRFPVLETFCPRCGAPQWSDAGGGCTNCGRAAHAPDN